MSTHAHAKPAGTPTWVDLVAPNAEAARQFYQAVFGWEYDIGPPEYGGYATARTGGRTAAGISGPQPDAPPMPATWNLYFASEAVAADVARATELGAQPLYPTLTVEPFGTMGGCQDTGGAAFHFWQAGQHIGAQVTDEPGAMAWCELYAPNAAQVRDFYSSLLGASVERVPGEPEYYILKHDDTMLCGIMQIDPAWQGFAPQWIVYFAVDDIEVAAARVREHGGEVLGTIDDSPFGRIAAVRDPQGAAFKLIEPPQQ